MPRVIFYFYSGGSGAHPLRLGGEGVDLRLADEWDDLSGLLADPNASPDFVILDSVPAEKKVEVVRRIKKIKNVPVIFFEEMTPLQKQRIARPPKLDRPHPRPAIEPKHRPRPAEPADSIEIARRYIDGHFQESLSLSVIAARAELSPSYFCRRFKARYGRSPITYIRNLRLGRAAHLLHNTDLPLAEIARESGFYSVSYFCREFKKAFGEPPIASRRAHKKKARKAGSQKKKTP